MTNHTFDQVKIKFEEFLSLLINILPCEKEIHVIQNKFRRHFNTAISDYLCSKEFVHELETIHQLCLEKKKSVKYYSLLASFDEQLKKHSIKSLPKSIPSLIAETPICTSSTIEILRSEFSLVEVQETLDYLLDQCSNIPSDTLVIDQVISLDTENNHERKIRRLEGRLHRLSKTIRELEEKEMSLDEMAHCDLYEVESNLKEQACELYQRIVTLKSQSSSIERILHQPITLNESEIGHSLISRDLQTMVNQSKNFPCFNDVLKTVDDANEKHRLHFNEEMRRKFAEKSFKIIGREIKDRRMADFRDIMSSRLPEDFNIELSDPALNNVEIEQVLQENQRDATIKTEKIFEEFARIDPGPDPEINLDSTGDEMEPETLEVNPTSSASTEPESNVIEAKAEISLHDRTLTILSTASLPTQILRSDDFLSSSSSSTVPKDTQVETLIPRHRSTSNDNEIIYQLYRQRLTNKSPVSTKRSFTESSNVKRAKPSPQPEIIVLD